MKTENKTPICLWEEKKTEVEKDEMEEVAAGQLAAREIGMDAPVVVLLSALNFSFREERRESEGFGGWTRCFHVTPNLL